MFYYGFAIYFDFEEYHVSKEEFMLQSSLEITRYYPRTLHNRGKDSFAYRSPFVCSKDQPYIDEMLDIFLEEMHEKYLEMEDYLLRKECQVHVVIIVENDYEHEDEDDDFFEGYRVSAKGIYLLSDMNASIESDFGIRDVVVKP